MTKLSDLGPPVCGKRHGGEPAVERDNFYTCPTCRQQVDMRDLRQVLWHGLTTNHEPLEMHCAEIIEFPSQARPGT